MAGRTQTDKAWWSKKRMSIQLAMFTPQVDWKLPVLSELPKWPTNGRVCIDVETRDEKLKLLGPGVRRENCYIAGIAFAIEDGPSAYLPIRHLAGDNLDEKRTIQYLKDQAKHFKGTIVGANLSYDLDFLAEEKVVYKSAAWFRDIQVADALIYELHLKYGMDAIAQRLGIPGKDHAILEEANKAYSTKKQKLDKKSLWKLPGRFVSEYALQDVRLPLTINRRLERKIDELDLWEIYDLESKLLPVLVKMRRRGVRINQDKLAKIEEWALNEEKKYLAEIHRLTGVSLAVDSIWNANEVAPAILVTGTKLRKTEKNQQYNIDKVVLAKMEHPVGNLILQARKVNKLRTTFADSTKLHMTNGRIHCTFNQLRAPKDEDDDSDDNLKGGRFGRISSDHTNLQQQPARDEFAAMWRSIYEPEIGTKWACLDFSQQEPRQLVHYAALLDLPRGREAAQKYIDDPTTDNHQMMADMTGLKRKQAKELFLGKCYGMGGVKLCMKLGLPTRWALRDRTQPWIIIDYANTRGEVEELHYKKYKDLPVVVAEVAGKEGQEIIDRFDDKLPFVKLLAKAVQKQADEVGHIRTILGRRCNFPEFEPGRYSWTHKALNRLIQGSSADQTKKSMVLADAAGFWLQLQVHDELDQSITDYKEAQDLAEIMKTSVPQLIVPSKVDIEIGPSWGEVKEWIPKAA